MSMLGELRMLVTRCKMGNHQRQTQVRERMLLLMTPVCLSNISGDLERSRVGTKCPVLKQT
jgi:hypothetical protein